MLGWNVRTVSLQAGEQGKGTRYGSSATDVYTYIFTKNIICVDSNWFVQRGSTAIPPPVKGSVA